MEAMTGEQLLDELRIPDGRRHELWERAERMRLGVDHARAVRAALGDERARRTNGGPA
ncbi:hypothetical protein [Streptomyces candidus]|uniref:Uncharacterized protein n=1 Tax=Streptomyces candidus TaxID=67283 RepID=A0A7X0LT86_9ACTN|nr:hypothetical protein [Streptomyces candidus]MBB6440070.1 hypothetical protein [Streptomyces candidus]